MEVLLTQPEPLQIDPPEELRARLLKQTAGWQMLPDIAIKALAMARDPNCSIRDFASLVETDPKLATEILRISNSIYYGSRNPILNLRQAVTRLGFAHCRNIILAASLGSAMRNIPLTEAWIQLVLWRHSVMTGIISMAINKSFSLGFIGEEFTAGLIHDIGRSLLAVISPTDFANADPLDFEEPVGILQHERDLLRVDHCELGAWFLIHNRLPEPLVDAVRLHHNPADARENRRLVALVATADHMANYLQRQGSADEYSPEENVAVDLLFEESPDDRIRFLEGAQSFMTEAMKEANSPNGPFGQS